VSTQIWQTSTVTAGHLAAWIAPGVLQDAGTATAGCINSLGLYGYGGLPFAITNSPVPPGNTGFTGQYSQFGMAIDATYGYLLLNSFGGAPAVSLAVRINGTIVWTVSGGGVTPDTPTYAWGLSATSTSSALPTVVTAVTNEFTTVSSGAYAQLSVSSVPGLAAQGQTVLNRGAYTLLVLPPTGWAIENNATNAPVGVYPSPGGGSVRFIFHAGSATVRVL
jgi:hypothetical protein